MIKSSTQLGFISARIEELQTAVFHSQSNNVLNLKATVISTLKVDIDGYIWFFINKPSQAVNEFEKQFPVALDFYKKGAMFFLNVLGMARMITDPEELEFTKTYLELSNRETNKILIRVKIAQVNYHEKCSSTQSWFTKRKRAFTELFVSTQEKLVPISLQE